MNIIRSNSPVFNEKCVVALGNFDGVHMGHRALISSCIRYAKENGLKSCIYTFEIHPSVILRNENILLTTNEEKLEIFEHLGCDNVYFESFNNVRDMSPSEFIEQIIINRLHAKCVVCGENYKFGKNGSGSVNDLKSLLQRHNVEVIIQPYCIYNGETVSSTAVRGYLRSGNIELANKLLCTPFSISGEIVHGKKLGRILGFPTLNMNIPNNKITPAFGVYASATKIDGTIRYGITNIGIRPTVDEDTAQSNVNCETHLIDYNGDDYGKTVSVKLLSYIRCEKKFSSVNELKAYISADCETARDFFLNISKEDMRILNEI